MMRNLVLAFVLLEALVRSAKFQVSITCSTALASYLAVVFFATELLQFGSANPNKKTIIKDVLMHRQTKQNLQMFKIKLKSSAVDKATNNSLKDVRIISWVGRC